jgi:hypothetical protein
MARLGERRQAMAVEAVKLVITALTAGAAAGLKDNATSAVKDSYAALINLVRRRLSKRTAEEDATDLEQYTVDPDSQRDALIEALVAADAGHDQALIAAAENVMTLVDPYGAQEGKYRVYIRDTTGIQIGDGNVMNFNR